MLRQGAKVTDLWYDKMRMIMTDAICFLSHQYTEMSVKNGLFILKIEFHVVYFPPKKIEYQTLN